MYEQGRREPSIKEAARIARFFNVSLEEVSGISVTLRADTSREKASEERQALLHLVEALPEERLAEAARYLRYLAGTESRAAKGA